MRLNLSLDVLLVRDGKFVVSWCPQLDVCSQGYTALEAIGMLAEAVRLTVMNDLTPFYYTPPTDDSPMGQRVQQRVRHPLRRGLDTRDEELTPLYEGLNADDAVTVNKDPDEFDRTGEPFGLTWMNVEAFSLGGVLVVNGPDACNCYYVAVPAATFDVRFRSTRLHHKELTVSLHDLGSGKTDESIRADAQVAVRWDRDDDVTVDLLEVTKRGV